LNDWLTKALASALETGTKTLTRELLNYHAIDAKRCDQMITESEEGEKLLSHDAEADERLLIRLGLKQVQKSRTKSPPQEETGEKPGGTPPHTQPTRVGQRTPSRDLVKS